MRYNIIPIGEAGLNGALENTVQIHLNLLGPASLEFLIDGKLEKRPGPKMSALTPRAEFSRATEEWLRTELVPLLQQWSDQNAKEILPDVLIGLTALVGFDVEKHLVYKAENRGACNECGYRCKIAETYMWHFRIGSGILIVTIEGKSEKDISAPAMTRPPFNVPAEAKVIAPTGCEAKANWAIPETIKYLSKLLLSEESSTALPTCFGAQSAERDEVNQLHEALSIEKIGIRCTESSVFLPGSVANATLKQYRDSFGAEPRKGLNCQADWYFKRSAPVDVWADKDAANFNIKRVKAVGKNETEKLQNKVCRMAYVYHGLDNLAPIFFTQTAVAKFLVSHPLVLLLGINNFVEEVIDIIIEVLGKMAVKGDEWYHAKDAQLPNSLKEVFAVIDSLHDLPFGERCQAYRRGAYSLFGVERSHMPQKKKMMWSASWRRGGKMSEPATISGTGKKRKNDGLTPLQQGEMYLSGTGSGPRIKIATIAAIGIDDYETVDGGKSKSRDIVEPQMKPDFVGGRDSDVTTVGVNKRSRDESLEVEPASKKFGVGNNNDSVPHVGGELNDSRVKEMKSLLPAASSLINMVVKAKEIDAGEFEMISEKLSKLVTDITTNDHIGKINSLNDPEAEENERYIAAERLRLKGLEGRINDRNRKIKELQEEQKLDKKSLKERSIVIQGLESQEEFRRSQYVEEGRKKREKEQKDAIKGAKMLMEAMTTKTSTSTGVPSTVRTKTTIVKTLSRIGGVESKKPVHHYLRKWADQKKYDEIRGDITNASSVVTMAMNTEIFREALEEFTSAKASPDVGNLLGIGTVLNDNRRASHSSGSTSWVLTNCRMNLLKAMKELYEKTHNEAPGVLWSDEQIANAGLHGYDSQATKLAENRDIRGRNLATQLAAKFNQAIIEVTGSDLFDVELWYFDDEFQQEYINMFREGQAVLSRAAADEGYYEYANNVRKARAKMEFLMAQRQMVPVSDDDCVIIDAIHESTAHIEVHEEEVDVDEDDVINEDVQEEVRHVIEVDEDERFTGRKAAHLRKYE